MYQPIQANRYWDRQRQYDQIDWENFQEVVDAFENRIDGWYLNPAQELAKDGHQAFSVLALDCLVIDMLSQFYLGKTRSSMDFFVDYSSNVLGFCKHLNPAIEYIKTNNNPGTLDTEAKALYVGFRCGILHEGHIALYGGIDPGQSAVFSFEYPSTSVKYSDGRDCPSLTINPLELLNHIDREFRRYLTLLKSGTDQLLINHFKIKFQSSFGISL